MRGFERTPREPAEMRKLLFLAIAGVTANSIVAVIVLAVGEVEGAVVMFILSAVLVAGLLAGRAHYLKRSQG